MADFESPNPLSSAANPQERADEPGGQALDHGVERDLRDKQVSEDVRDILREHARLRADPASVRDGDNLYDSGMTSHATIHVMLALEERFDVEFPDSLLTRNVFATIANITTVVRQLSATGEGA